MYGACFIGSQYISECKELEIINCYGLVGVGLQVEYTCCITPLGFNWLPRQDLERYSKTQFTTETCCIIIIIIIIITIICQGDFK